MTIEPNPGSLAFHGAGGYGVGEWTLSGIADLTVGTYTIRVRVTDEDLGATNKDVQLVVVSENTETQFLYTGDTFVFTAGPTIGSAPVQVSAQLTQLDAYLGNITTARVRLEFYKGGNLGTTPDLIVGNLPVSAVGYVQTTVTLGVDNWTVHIKAEPSPGFWRASPIGMGAVTVEYGSTDQRVTGGGWIPDDGSANGKGTFGFTVRNQKNGSPKGNLVYVSRGTDGFNYVVKSNSWQGGGLSFYTTLGKAAFSGKCVVQKVDPDTGIVVASFGNYTFTVNILDGDLYNPKISDRFAITVYTSSGGVWRQLGSSVSLIALGGGNVSVFSSSKPLTLNHFAAGTDQLAPMATLPAVSSIVEAAKLRWEAHGADPSRLREIGLDSVRIGDLPGTTLGMADAMGISIDLNAGGMGWFIDATPLNDSEFLTPGDQGEQRRVDLLTVVTHEIGHLLGLDDLDPNLDDDDVMEATLGPGIRRVLDDAPSDLVRMAWLSAAESLAKTSAIRQSSPVPTRVVDDVLKYWTVIAGVPIGTFDEGRRREARAMNKQSASKHSDGRGEKYEPFAISYGIDEDVLEALARDKGR